GYQRNTADPVEVTAEVKFPEPLDLETALNAVVTISDPTFTLLDEKLELVPADVNGEGGIAVEAVRLELDAHDPWFAKIAKNARPGTPYLRARHCTLYLHPASGELRVYESDEPGDTLWDHPVA